MPTRHSQPRPESQGVSLPGEARHSRPAHTRPQKRAGGSPFNDEERERGLVALALYSGNARRASKALKDQGLSVGATTLRDWRNADSLAYYKLQQNVLPEVRERAAEMHTDLAEREVELSGRLVRDLGERMDKEKMPVRDLPGAIRNLDVGAGVNRTKAGELRGEPNVRVEKQQDVGDILRALEAEGFPLPEHVKAAIDVEVVEEPPDEAEGLKRRD